MEEDHPYATVADAPTQLLREVLRLAREAYEAGESPFSALVVVNGQVVGRGLNRTRSSGNPTVHAEMAAIADACEHGHGDALSRGTVYCSCEPCIMCLMAMYYCGVRDVVYLASIDDAIRYGSGDPHLATATIIELGALGMQVKSAGQAYASQAVALFQEKVRRDGSL